VSLEWKVDERQIELQQSDLKRILEFSLEYTKIPKDKYKIIKNSKKVDGNKNDNDIKRSSLEKITDLGLSDAKKDKKKEKKRRR